MSRYVVLVRYRTADFSGLVQKIIGLKFRSSPSLVGTTRTEVLRSRSDGRLVYLYDCLAGLPSLLEDLVAVCPNRPVQSALCATYDPLPDETADEASDRGFSEINQLMLNFASDIGALTLVNLDDVRGQETTPQALHFEWLKPRIHHRSGIQTVDPAGADVVSRIRDRIVL